MYLLPFPCWLMYIYLNEAIPESYLLNEETLFLILGTTSSGIRRPVDPEFEYRKWTRNSSYCKNYKCSTNYCHTKSRRYHNRGHGPTPSHTSDPTWFNKFWNKYLEFATATSTFSSTNWNQTNRYVF